MKKIHFTCDAANILCEAENHFLQKNYEAAIGLVQGLQMIRRGLYEIGILSLELNDKKLNEILIILGVLKPKSDRS